MLLDEDKHASTCVAKIEAQLAALLWCELMCTKNETR